MGISFRVTGQNGVAFDCYVETPEEAQEVIRKLTGEGTDETVEAQPSPNPDFEFQVGDVVRIKEDLARGIDDYGFFTSKEMIALGGKEFTVTAVGDASYGVSINLDGSAGEWYWRPYQLELVRSKFAAEADQAVVEEKPDSGHRHTVDHRTMLAFAIMGEWFYSVPSDLFRNENIAATFHKYGINQYDLADILDDLPRAEEVVKT